MTPLTLRRRSSRILASSVASILALGALGAPSTSTANTSTWTSTAGGDWATGTNWDTAPASGDSLVFGGTTSQTPTNTLTDSSFAIGGLTFNNTGSYSISGNAFLLSGGISSTSTTGTQTISNNIVLGATQTITAAAGTSINLGGIISDGGSNFGLISSGAGNLILSGLNTFTGGINLNNSTTTGITTISGTNVAQTWTISDNSFRAGVLISNSGAFASGSTLNITTTQSFPNGFQIADSVGTVGTGSTITVSGAGRGTFAIGTGDTLVANITNNNNNVLQFVVGNNSAISGNITLGSGSFSVRNDLATLTGVTKNNSGTFTISGNISGTGGMSAPNSFTGTLVLSGNNSNWSGPVGVAGNKMLAGSDSAFGTGAVSIANGNTATTGTIGAADAIARILSNNIVIGPTSGANTVNTLAIDATNAAVTLNGNISEGASGVGGKLSTSGTNAVTLGGINSFTGGVSLGHSGLTKITGTNAAQTWTISDAAYKGGILISNSGAFGSASTLSITSSSVNFPNGLGLADNTSGSVGSGSTVNITTSGSGRAFFELGTNTTLAANISTAGPIQFGIGSGATVSGNISVGSGGIAIRNDGTVPLMTGITKSNSGTFTISGNLSGSGQFNNPNSFTGTLALTGDNSVYSGNILTVGYTALSFTQNLGTGTVSLGNTTTGQTLNYTGTGSTTAHSTTLSGGSGGATISQNGTGSLKLTGNVTNTGLGSKTLTLQGSTAGTGELSGIISNNATTGSTQLNATFAVGATQITLASVDGIVANSSTISGTGITGSALITAVDTVNKKVTIAATSGAGAAVGAAYTVTGVQNLTGVTKSGTGAWTLSGANTYSGGTTLSGGTLVVGSNTALGTGSLNLSNVVTLSATTGNTITLANTVNIFGNSTYNFGDATNTGSLNLTTAVVMGGFPKTFNVASGVTVDMQGVVSASNGSATFTKGGAGALKLSATDTYTGTTAVNAGTLVVNGSISGSSSTVNSGGTMSGSGTVGAVTVNTGGNLNPGDGLGILNSKNLTLAGALNADITGAAVGTGYDQLNVTGTVNVTGATLNLALSFTPADNGLFFLVSNDSTDAVTGTFTNLPTDGSVFTLGGQQWQISYAANFTNGVSDSFTGGNDIALMAVPEPASFAAMLGGMGVLLARRRRNRA